MKLLMIFASLFALLCFLSSLQWELLQLLLQLEKKYYFKITNKGESGKQNLRARGPGWVLCYPMKSYFAHFTEKDPDIGHGKGLAWSRGLWPRSGGAGESVRLLTPRNHHHFHCSRVTRALMLPLRLWEENTAPSNNWNVGSEGRAKFSSIHFKTWSNSTM